MVGEGPSRNPSCVCPNLAWSARMVAGPIRPSWATPTYHCRDLITCAPCAASSGTHSQPLVRPGFDPAQETGWLFTLPVGAAPRKSCRALAVEVPHQPSATMVRAFAAGESKKFTAPSTPMAGTPTAAVVSRCRREISGCFMSFLSPVLHTGWTGTGPREQQGRTVTPPARCRRTD